MKVLVFLSAILVTASAYAQPWEPVVLWDRPGEGDSSRFGTNVFPLGDQNQDGYADWGVEAMGWGGPNQPSAAKIELFYGGNPPSMVPYRVFAIDTSMYSIFGSGAGDINGDGYEDWLIEIQYRLTWQTIEAALYLGGPQADSLPLAIFHLRMSATTGESLQGMGDFNGDGFDDLYRYDLGNDIGYICFGSSTIDTLADLTLHSPPGHRYQSLPQAFGDLNGDGYTDFVSCTPIPESLLHIFFGGVQPDTSPVAIWMNYGDYPLGIVNDLNRDGRMDLITAANPHLNVHWGGAVISQVPDDTLFFFGCSNSVDKIVSAGDVNRDGYQDLLVVNRFCYNHWGKLGLYLGGASLASQPILELLGRTDPLNLIGIYTATGLGDVNGDGTNDFAVGALNDDFDGFRGRVVILSGDSTLAADTPPAVPREFTVSVYPNPFNSMATIELHLPAFTQTVQLTVFNVLGQQVFSDQLQPTGSTLHYTFDGSALSTGLYFLTVQSGSVHATKKLMLLR